MAKGKESLRVHRRGDQTRCIQTCERLRSYFAERVVAGYPEMVHRSQPVVAMMQKQQSLFSGSTGPTLPLPPQPRPTAIINLNLNLAEKSKCQITTINGIILQYVLC